MPTDERNQCDGCRRGLPINAHGHHEHPEHGYRDAIGCTADCYRTAPEPAETPQATGTTQDAQYRCPTCGLLTTRVRHLPHPAGSTATCLNGHEWDPFPAAPDETTCRVCGQPMNGEGGSWHPQRGPAHYRCSDVSGRDRVPETPPTTAGAAVSCSCERAGFTNVMCRHRGCELERGVPTDTPAAPVRYAPSWWRCLCPPPANTHHRDDARCDACGATDPGWVPPFPPDTPDAHWRPASDCNTPTRCMEHGCEGFCHLARQLAPEVPRG